MCEDRKAQATTIQKAREARQEMGAVMRALGAPKTVTKPPKGVPSEIRLAIPRK